MDKWGKNHPSSEEIVLEARGSTNKIKGLPYKPSIEEV